LSIKLFLNFLIAKLNIRFRGAATAGAAGTCSRRRRTCCRCWRPRGLSGSSRVVTQDGASAASRRNANVAVDVVMALMTAELSQPPELQQQYSDDLTSLGHFSPGVPATETIQVDGSASVTPFCTALL